MKKDQRNKNQTKKASVKLQRNVFTRNSKGKNKIRAGTCPAFKKAVVSYFLTGLIVSNERLKKLIEIPL